MTERKANFILLICAIVWGWGFIAGKMALSTLNPFVVLTIRFGLAALLMWLIFRKNLVNAPKSTIKVGLIIGLFQAAGILIQLIGLNYTTTAKQAFLVPSYVVFVPFLSWLVYKKSPGIRAVISGLVSILGIGLITLTESFKMNMGDSISLCFAVIFGFEILYIDYAMNEKTDVYQVSFYEYAFVAFIGLIACLIKGSFSGDILECFRVSFSVESLLGILYLGSFNTVFAFTAQNKSQIYTKPTTAALIIGLESVFGFLFSIIYYHEIISFRFAMGAVLCFSAILLSTVGNKSQ